MHKMNNLKRFLGAALCFALICLCLILCYLKPLNSESIEERYGTLCFSYVFKSGSGAIVCYGREDGIFVLEEIDSNYNTKFLIEKFQYKPTLSMPINGDEGMVTAVGIRQFDYGIDKNAFPHKYLFLKTDKGYFGTEEVYWAPTHEYHSYGGDHPEVNVEKILCTGYTLSILFGDDGNGPSTLYERLPYIELCDEERNGHFTVKIHGKLEGSIDSIETVVPEGWQVKFEESCLSIECPVNTYYTIEHYTDKSNGVTVANDQKYPILIDTISASGVIEVVIHFAP